MPAEPDVLIIGAGVVGLSIAYHLDQSGASVTVLDRAGIGAGASGVQPGGLRQQWGTRVNCTLARESMDFYTDVRERLRMRVDPGFRACGYLFLAHSEDVLGRLRENVRLQNSLGVSSRIVTPVEIAELVPGLDVATVVAGAWSADDGYFDRPQSIVQAFGALADVQLGDVRAVGDDGVVTLQSGDQLEPGAIVIATGVDTPRLLPELPIHAEARYLFFSDPIAERLLEPLVISAELRFAAKQLADGRLLASDLGAHGRPETDSDDWRATLREAREALLPRLVYVALPQLVEGLYDATPDHQAILGRVRDRVWVAAGFSGHGFMHAPAVGRILAEAVLEGREDEALGILDSGRFAEGRLVPEPQVV